MYAVWYCECRVEWCSHKPSGTYWLDQYTRLTDPPPCHLLSSCTILSQMCSLSIIPFVLQCLGFFLLWTIVLLTLGQLDTSGQGSCIFAFSRLAQYQIVIRCNRDFMIFLQAFQYLILRHMKFEPILDPGLWLVRREADHMGIVRTKDISICPVCKSPLCAMLFATFLVLNVHNVSCISVHLRGKVAAWNNWNKPKI